MATTATEADTGRTLSGHDEAAEHIARQAFADAQVGAVGLELESHTVELTAPHRRITWNRLREVGDSVPDLPGSSAITFEPGGAVELSGPPCSDVWSAISSMRADHEILTAVYRGAGIALASLGTDPLRRPERVNPGARYVAMERHFGAAGYGETALQMMTCTASLQVNVQSGTPRQWRDRFVLAQRIGPTMAALSASSPMLTGRPTGRRNTRQWIWDNLDPRRCAPSRSVSTPPNPGSNMPCGRRLCWCETRMAPTRLSPVCPSNPGSTGLCRLRDAPRRPKTSTTT